MRKKITVYLLFFLLSVTPFVRGCSIAVGFPFSVSTVDTPSNPYITHMEDLRPDVAENGILLLAVNVLIAYLVSRIVCRHLHIRWMTSFLNALALNLLLSASILFFFGFEEPVKPFLNLLYKVYFAYGLTFYFYKVPNLASEWIGNAMDSAPRVACGIYNAIFSSEALTGILVRVWFVALTIALAAALYLIQRLLQKTKARRTTS